MSIELNNIYNGNNIELIKDIEDSAIDLTVTSPPYDNLREYDSNEQFSIQNCEALAKELFRVTKDGGVVVWIVADATINGSESGTSFRQALCFMDNGFNLHDTMIWNKGSFSFPSNSRYHQVFEYMFVFSKGKPKTMNFICDRPNKYIGRRGASGRKKDGTRNKGFSEVTNEYGKRFNIWECPIGGGHSSTDKIAFQHPAIFPEQLVKDHILSWSNEGDTVFDPFMSSGTTCKMASLTNRKFIGFEISKEYFEIARKRLQDMKTIDIVMDEESELLLKHTKTLW